MKQSMLKKAVLIAATTLSFACSAAASELIDGSRVRREVASAETHLGEMPMSRIPAQAMRCEFGEIDAEIERRHADGTARSGDTAGRL